MLLEQKMQKLNRCTQCNNYHFDGMYQTPKTPLLYVGNSFCIWHFWSQYYVSMLYNIFSCPFDHFATVQGYSHYATTGVSDLMMPFRPWQLNVLNVFKLDFFSNDQTRRRHRWSFFCFWSERGVKDKTFVSIFCTIPHLNQCDVVWCCLIIFRLHILLSKERLIRPSPLLLVLSSFILKVLNI